MIDITTPITEIEAVALMTRLDLAYSIGEPLVSDTEYDRIRTMVKELFPGNPYFQTVGAPVKGDKVKLPVVLGSLSKVKPDGSWSDWAAKHPGEKVYWEKLDGASLLIDVEYGKVTRVYTRGDGEYGQDVTDKVAYCSDLSQIDGSIPFVRVRGEALLFGEDHKTLGFKTRRNGVVGLLNRDDLTDIGHIRVKVYELVECSEGVPDTEFHRAERMWTYGFNMAGYVLAGDKTEEQMADLLFFMKGSAEYDIDGIVVAVNNSLREDALLPDNKCAYKISEDAVLTTVTGIEWNVGRTGRIVPTVLIEPFVMQGVTIERATGFNASFIQDNSIRVGTKVYVTRANDVIPHITEVVND